MPHRLVTDFVAPEDTHTVLVLVPHYWGRAATKAEAMVNVKAEGGRPAQTGYVAYYFGEGFKPGSMYVDGMGGVNWEVTEEMADRPYSEWPQPVKEEVLSKPKAKR